MKKTEVYIVGGILAGLLLVGGVMHLRRGISPPAHPNGNDLDEINYLDRGDEIREEVRNANATIIQQFVRNKQEKMKMKKQKADTITLGGTRRRNGRRRRSKSRRR